MHQFDAACLLQAEHKAPFFNSEHLILQDRHGAAIWWWESSAVENGDGAPATSTKRLPESACRRLTDGWHHLELETGFEALLVQNGLVIGSAWRRSPFDGYAWRTFVDDQGEDRIGPHSPPATLAYPYPSAPTLKTAGKIVVTARSPLTRAFSASILAIAAVSSFWTGESHSLKRRANSENAEAQRLESTLSKYGLFARVRNEASQLREARKAIGSGKVAIALGDALELAASNGLKVVSFKIDAKDFEIVVQSQNSTSSLRAMADGLEALAAFSSVSAVESEAPGSARLVSKVTI